MKQPTTEEKARYFASYYGQEILMYDNSEGDKFWEKQIYPIDAKNLQCNLSIMHILLKPLSAISDKDRHWICKQSAYRETEKNFKAISDGMIKHLFELNKWSGNTILYIYQYLQLNNISAEADRF